VAAVIAGILAVKATAVHAAGSLDVNLAGRYTDYSTSGSVETWKAGHRSTAWYRG
jgi:hypothetical protein